MSNSHQVLVKAQEIEKRSLWPVTIVLDKHDGKYTGGRWIAYNDKVIEEMNGSDKEQQEFVTFYTDTKDGQFRSKNILGEPLVIVAGRTPTEVLSMLIKAMSIQGLLNNRYKKPLGMK